MKSSMPLTLPWLMKSEENNVYVTDSKGNFICRMADGDHLSAAGQKRAAENIVYCVNTFHELLAIASLARDIQSGRLPCAVKPPAAVESPTCQASGTKRSH